MAKTSSFVAPVVALALLVSAVAVVLCPRPVLAADYWSVTVTADAASDGSNAALSFGTRNAATDDFDGGGVDMPAAPPAPGATFGSYFQIAGPIFSQLYDDYRAALGTAPGSTIAWTLHVQSSSQPISLHWSNPAGAGVPPDASLILSGGGQTIDMRTTFSATYASGTSTLTITATRLSGPSPTPVDNGDSTTDSTVDDPVNNDGPTNGGSGTGVINGDAPTADGAGEGVVSNAILHIVPTQVLPNEEVTISTGICANSGEGGSRTVSLLVNGVVEQSQSVIVSGGSCQQVTFNVSRTTPGVYEVAIGDMVGQFAVLSPGTITSAPPPQQPTTLVTAGIIAIIAIMVALIAALIIAFRRT